MGSMADRGPSLKSSSDALETGFQNDIDSLSRFDYADNATAQELHALSSQDRNAINEEIHGVRSTACEETPELVEGSLRQLSIELQNLPSHYKAIYVKAAGMAMNTSKKFKSDGREELVGDDHSSLQDFSPIPMESNSPSTCYVKSRDFQLAFLRCEYFNPKKAAIRLAKYLELSYELYGEDALRRPLRIDDLNSREEIEILNAGHQQLLPFRDRSGRRVLAIHGDLSLPSSSLLARSVLSRGPAMKLLLYLWSVLIQDVDAQRRGLVVVFWPRYVDHKAKQSDHKPTEATAPSRKSKRLKKRKPRKSKRDYGIAIERNNSVPLVPDSTSRSTGIGFFEAVPVRACAIHCCLPDTPFFQMIRHILLLILGDYRTRVKAHQGLGIEVSYSLMGYGIPVDTLPMDEVTQTIKTKNQASFIRVRSKIEAELYGVYSAGFTSNSSGSSDESTTTEVSNRSSMIECPSLNDVIFRSGKSYMSHPGNMMFRELIEKHIEEHNMATQDRKKNLTWQVIDEVEMKGGRFLEYDRGLGTWTELAERSAIRHKIATYFKEYRRKIKAHNRIQESQSSTHEFEAQDGRKIKRRKSSKCLPEECFSSL